MFAEKIRAALDKIKKAVFIDEDEINAIVKDIQRALLSADVSLELVLEISKKLREEAKKKLAPGESRQKLLLKKTYELLKEIIGEEAIISKEVKKILLLGLYGSGKTTTVAKLANYFLKRGKTVAVITTDIYRPAAYEQLLQLTKKLNVKVYAPRENESLEEFLNKTLNSAREDIIILDSAGRSSVDKELLQELKLISEIFNPDLKILILSADIGQVAQKQIKAFNEATKIDGVILTKMDSSAKAGGALAACKLANAKIYFITTGEKINDIEEFNPDAYLQRVLGIPDLNTLIKKISQTTEISDIEKLRNFEDFNFEIFQHQLKMSQNLGPLQKVAELLGISNLPPELLQLSEQKFKKYNAIINSMTKQERKKPEILNKSRILRIAKGSGTTEQEVRELIANFKRIKKVFCKLKGFDESQISEQKMKNLLTKFKPKKIKFKI